MEHFKSTSVAITDIWQSSCQYPDVTVNSKNEVFAVWEKYVKATVVDHMKPHRGDPVRADDRSSSAQ